MALSDAETVVAHKLTVMLVEKGIMISCVSCDLFDIQDENCKMFNTRPPAKTIATGCMYYENTLPF